MTTRPNRVSDTLLPSTNARAKKDIQQWRTALQAAENAENPKRLLLYSLYDEIILDLHLTSEMEKRKLAISGAEYNLKDANGVVDAEATKLLQKSWFDEFISLAMDSIFWGHSLIEIAELNEDGTIKKVELVPRRHVIPEKGLFVSKQGEEKGILFREDKKYAPWLLEVGKPKNLGLLNKCAPQVLYKRFGQAAWAEYGQLFGNPMRIGKTEARDTTSLNRLYQMLAEVGSAGFGVLQDGESIEFIEAGKAGADVFKEQLNFCNSELSKGINSSVIGEAGNGGSNAKEKVGLEIQQSNSKGDAKLIQGIVNDVLIPRMVLMGYPVQDRVFEFERVKDVKQEFEIVNGLLDHYDIAPEDIKATFGYNVLPKKAPTGTGKLGAGFFG